MAGVDDIDGALGELSMFHQTFGFYVHGLSIEGASLAEGWTHRVIKVQSENARQCIGWCIEAHDLAASKLVAFRDKDRSLVRILLMERLVDRDTLIARIKSVHTPRAHQQRLTTWINGTSPELGLDDLSAN